MYTLVGSQCKKNQLIWINGLKDMASGSLKSNLNKFEFELLKNVKFWFYNILLVTMSTQEKESMNLDIRVSRYT